MGRKKGCFLSLILTVLIVVGLTVTAFYYFNKERAYRYFPNNPQFVARIDNHRAFLHLTAPFVQKNEKLRTLLNLPLIKHIPAPRVYVVIDKKGEAYMFAELSFAARFLKEYGKVDKNVFCFTTNKTFDLVPTEHTEKNETLREFVTKKHDGDAMFYYPVPQSEKFPFLNNKILEGTINAQSSANALQIHLKLPYEYKKVGFTSVSSFDKYIPDRPDMYVMLTFDDFEVHYAALRKLVFQTDFFQSFYQTKLMVFDKSGIDIENHLIPMVSERFYIGVYNKTSVMCLGSGSVEKRMNQVETDLVNRFPIEFETRDYNGTSFKTPVITGILGFLARGIAGDSIEGLKRPFYYMNNDVFFLFDSLESLKHYVDRDEKHNLRRDELHKKMENLLPSDRHITVFLSDRMVRDMAKKQEVSENIGHVIGAFSFSEQNLDGTIVIRLNEQ